MERTSKSAGLTPSIEFQALSAVEDSLLKYAVIVSRHQGHWIYCKHKERDTWEIPGGRREAGENILDTAKRELLEETGALAYEITPLCTYCVIRDFKSYGLLCYSDIHALGRLPDSEIECIRIFEDEPSELTYPHFHPLFLAKVKHWLAEKEG